MDEFTKPSITRLSRKAGVKLMSEDCYDTIRNLIGIKLDEVIKNVLIVNEQKGTRTILPDDLLETLSLSGILIARSEDLNKDTCSK